MNKKILFLGSGLILLVDGLFFITGFAKGVTGAVIGSPATASAPFMGIGAVFLILAGLMIFLASRK